MSDVNFEWPLCVYWLVIYNVIVLKLKMFVVFCGVFVAHLHARSSEKELSCGRNQIDEVADRRFFVRHM